MAHSSLVPSEMRNETCLSPCLNRGDLGLHNSYFWSCKGRHGSCVAVGALVGKSRAPSLPGHAVLVLVLVWHWALSGEMLMPSVEIRWSIFTEGTFVESLVRINCWNYHSSKNYIKVSLGNYHTSKIITTTKWDEIPILYEALLASYTRIPLMSDDGFPNLEVCACSYKQADNPHMACIR